MKHKSNKTKKARRAAFSKPVAFLPITTPAERTDPVRGFRVDTICISKDEKGSLLVDGKPATIELYNGIQLRLKIRGGYSYIIFDKFNSGQKPPMPIKEMNEALEKALKKK